MGERYFDLAVAVNLGMFQEDHRTHVGFLRYGKRIESRKWRKTYLSMFAVGPKKPGLPQATILDLDVKKSRELRKHYNIVVQNLRLIKQHKGHGRSVWRKKRRRWSETALAMDRKGRILFLHTRTPLTMERFGRILLQQPLGILRAMHLEGGPEASLSIRTRSIRRDFNGSFETGFNENDNSSEQWPIPNVIGVVRQP